MKNKANTTRLNSALAALIFASCPTYLQAATMFNTDYQADTYNWAPMKSYNLGGNHQSDAFRDLTWYTHGSQDPADYNVVIPASFTSPGGVTLSGGSIGSYIKWGIQGSGTMPPGALLGPIQSGTVTQALLDANPITPKSIGDERLFSVSTSTPIDGLASLVFQLRTGTIFPESPDFTPFELAQMAAPVVLSLNGGSILLDWDYRELTHVSADMFSAAYTQEVWAFQWDLSGIEEPITDFSIHWDSHPFGNVFGAQVDQSSTFTQVIPEPSSLGLAAVGFSLCFRRSRKRA